MFHVHFFVKESKISFFYQNIAITTRDPRGEYFCRRNIA